MLLFVAWVQRKLQLLTWFNRSNGKKLRLRTGIHQNFELDYSCCARCNVNNANNRGGKKPRTFCGLLAVQLFTYSTSTRSSCMREIYSARNLQQRVNIPTCAM